jgi:hypothetical protein
MKKLLASTALMGALVISGSSFAETKFGGNIENTWTSQESMVSGTATKDSKDAIGNDIEITVSHTKELDNGWKFVGAFAIDESANGSIDTSRANIQLSKDGITLQIGSEGIQGAEYYPIPTVADITCDLPGLGSTCDYGKSLNDAQALGLAVAVPGGVIEALYAPDASSGDAASDSNVDNQARLGTAATANYLSTSTAQPVNLGAGAEVAYKFKALEGALTGHVAAHQAGAREGVLDHGDQSAKSASLQYNFGTVKVGAGRLLSKGAKDATSTTDRTVTTDSFGITLAASDDLSLGVQYKESSSDEWTSDEKVTAVSAAYNFGGVGFSLTYAQNENDGGTTSKDQELVVFRTKTAF